MAHVELNLDERKRFYQLMECKVKIAEIAKILKRHRSTLYRELKRNYWHDNEVPVADGYWPVTAHEIAKSRRKRQRKLVRFPELLNEVIGKLRVGWSPEQISGRLKAERSVDYSISHETIYQFVYSKDGQKRKLPQLLPEKRKRRKSLYSRKARSNVFPEQVWIRNRPVHVNKRSNFGHWEADLMIFRKDNGSANVATIVERTSRFVLLFKNNDRRSKPIMDKLIDLMSPLPFEARQSITFDRGLEFVSWRELHIGMGTQSWFCDPSAPWQKGSVENMNKRIRRYLPRERPVLSVPDQEMRAICDNLNATPRKCLGYKTPAEVFRHELRQLQI